MILKTGMRPPAADAIKWRFETIFKASDLPPIPTRPLGRTRVLGPNVGMYGNDEYGDCVWAGGAREESYWTARGGAPATFTTATVFSDYGSTGFDPTKTDASGENPTDQGSDPAAAAAYRRQTGLIDTTGKRHKIDAYVSLNPINPEALKLALGVLGPIGWGLMLPDYAIDQFNNQQPWTVLTSHPQEPTDGHYVSLYDINTRGNLLCWTWGRDQAATPEFIAKYGVVAIGYLNLEELDAKGLSPEGFDRARLTAMLAELDR